MLGKILTLWRCLGASVLAAGCYGGAVVGGIRALEQLLLGLAALAWLVRNRKQLDYDLARRRLEHCERCELLNRRLLSCGTPCRKWINPLTGTEEFLGCFCAMPLKALVPDASCWLNEKTNGQMGWPPEIRRAGRERAERKRNRAT